MKKDCAYIRKSLRKYLRGHLFKYEQVRIARHLNACPLCRSEFQSLKKAADTKQLLKDITPPEGLGQRVRATVSGIARLKVLLYRPLWLGAIVAAFALAYVNIFTPHRDIEIENIEKTLPPPAPVASSPTSTPASAGLSVSAPQQQAAVAQAEPKTATAPDPLRVTIAPRNENAVRRINELLLGQDQFKKTKFSDSVQEISGSLTAKELTAFLTRIEHSGRVIYSRKRFESFPAADPIPFVLKMKTPAREVPPSQAKSDSMPSEAAGVAPMPASAPTVSAP